MKLCLMRIMTVREYTCSNKKVKDKTNSPFGGEVGMDIFYGFEL